MSQCSLIAYRADPSFSRSPNVGVSHRAPLRPWCCDAYRHLEYREWLRGLLAGPEPYVVSDFALNGMVRLSTDKRVFRSPTPLQRALAFAGEIRHQPHAGVVNPATTDVRRARRRAAAWPPVRRGGRGPTLAPVDLPGLPGRAFGSGVGRVVTFCVLAVRVFGPRGAVATPVRGTLILASRGAAEHLVLDPGQRVLEDRPQVAEGVLADELRVPRGLAQVPGEIDGQPFQVAEQAGVEAR